MNAQVSSLPSSLISPEDRALILRIAQRASDLAKREGVYYTVVEAAMDLETVHASSPLRLSAMLAGSDGDLSHDTFGIHLHLDRSTGKLSHGFLPRYTAPARDREPRTIAGVMVHRMTGPADAFGGIPHVSIRWQTVEGRWQCGWLPSMLWDAAL